MTCDKKGAGQEEKTTNVEKLTDEKLGGVAGGMNICIICRPHPKKDSAGTADDPEGQPLCKPQVEGPEIRPCLPRGY